MTTQQPAPALQTAVVPPSPPPPPYALRFSVDYPDRLPDKFSSFFRIFFVIPIAIVLGAIGGGSYTWTSDTGDWWAGAAGTGGVLFLAVLSMIVFRQKYPRWWWDFNIMLMRFQARVWAYLALMRDEYPSTDEEQSVHLEADYPDVVKDLNRWMPLVKWFLAIPHYIVLFFLVIAAIVVVIIAWFNILFGKRFPRGMFDFVEGVMRWGNRVIAYAFLLNTDTYPPFELK